MAKKREIKQLVVFSDLHSGSRRALMKPEYTLFEEGKLEQTIKANKQQLWLYEAWSTTWEKVLKYVGNDPWAMAFMGDAIQGNKYKDELISDDVTDHMIIFDQLVRPYSELAAKRYFVRGTQSHVYTTTEMKLAEKLECERHPDTGQWAADRWLLDINGFTVLLRHHMSTTSRENLRTSQLGIEYANEVAAANSRGQPIPTGCVFAHRHMYDWWENGSNFAMVCGPWQQTTRYGHTKWSPLVPQPTITVLDWRDSVTGGLPDPKNFLCTPQPATVEKV